MDCTRFIINHIYQSQTTPADETSSSTIIRYIDTQFYRTCRWAHFRPSSWLRLLGNSLSSLLFQGKYSNSWILDYRPRMNSIRFLVIDIQHICFWWYLITLPPSFLTIIFCPVLLLLLFLLLLLLHPLIIFSNTNTTSSTDLTIFLSYYYYHNFFCILLLLLLLSPTLTNITSTATTTTITAITKHY